MPEIIDWPRDDSAEVLARVAEHLRQGQLVVVPTDTVYTLLAHGLRPEAVGNLHRLLNQQGTLTVALASSAEVHDWLPYLDGLGLRLARNCWPGPLTLLSGAGAAVGLASRLPAEVRQLLFQGEYLPVRTPGHPAIGQIMRCLAGPVVMVELPGLTGPQEAQEILGDQAALILNDGPTYFGGPATVVKVHGPRWELVHAGVLSPQALADLAVCRILFVCTGNTCRSPLAMSLCSRLLAQKLNCPISELSQRGFQVHSAGLAAIMGGEASPEAVEIARELGADLQEHRSQPLSPEMLARADYLFTMTASHLRLLQSLNLDIGPVPQMLSPQGEDVVDPIGGDTEVYRQCAQQILEYLEARLPELVEA
jgi:protein-tyrosine-phosphatase/tRNA A37 threonylcarbamoyladenosine synthetase subunit TsaC/SUA5/YrdC